MKSATTLLLLLCAVGAAAQAGSASQNLPAASLKKGTWDIGVWTGGGTALTGSTSNTRFWSAGVRFGRILTQEHGSGWLRGNLEWAADVIPAYVVFQNKTVYGAGLDRKSVV